MLLVNFDPRVSVTADTFQKALTLAKVRGQVKQDAPVQAEIPIQPNQTAEDWLFGLLTLFNLLAPEETVTDEQK